MPLAKPFNRSDVGRRSEEPQVCELALIEKLVRRSRVTDKAETAKFKESLDCTIREYRLQVLTEKQQERPAQIVAALKPGVKAAKKLLAWLDSLPVGLLIELQAGGVKEFCTRVIAREAYWQGHVNAYRPAGKGAASLHLRRSLKDIITAHRPDPPLATEQDKRFKEQRLRDWVAFACGEIGAPFPHQKKRRRQFVGESKTPPQATPQKKRRHKRSDAERRLKDVPL
jgi:hypothetical protein